MIFATTFFLVLPALARAFWILDHSSLTQDRLDPIVEEGRVSAHVHNIIGGSAFGATLDTGRMAAAACSTAPVQADRSNYWVPQLYHRDANGVRLCLSPIMGLRTLANAAWF